MDRLFHLADQKASTSWEEAPKIGDPKLLSFMEKIPICSHFNISRGNYYASSWNEKPNMIQTSYVDMMKQCKGIFIFIFLEGKCWL